MTIFGTTENATAGMLATTVENHIITAVQVISSIGTQAYTIGGTVAAGIYQYQLMLTRASDGRVIHHDGNFIYQNSPVPSVADFASKFALHLSMYWDVRASSSAAVLTLAAGTKGYTPDLLLRNGTITLAAGARSAATAPTPFAYGDVVMVSKGNNGEMVAALPATPVNPRPLVGIIVNNGYNAIDPTEYKSAHNRTWGVLLKGDIWVRQAGSAPVDQQVFNIGLLGTRMPTTLEPLAGKFLGSAGWDVGGVLPSLGRWRSAGVELGEAPTRFSTVDIGTPAGQLFRVSVG